MLVGVVVLALLRVLGDPAAVPAQLGVVNPAALPPGSPATPFGRSPHPFNNAHPAQPWSQWNRVVRELVVAPRIVVVPMVVPPSGSWPATVVWQTVMLPAYRVTETSYGYLVHEHWGVEPIGRLYYWAWRPTYYVSK
ncbi:MAG: hypothetical protein ACREK6_01525 [Candidatus Rokuibacteriota bacterium]